MLSYIDVRSIPVSAQWDELNAGIYGDSRLSDQVCMWVNRFEKETTFTVSFPQNPVARESVARYIRALKSVYPRVAEHGRQRRILPPGLVSKRFDRVCLATRASGLPDDQ